MRSGGRPVIGPVSKIRVRPVVHDVVTSRIGVGQRFIGMHEHTNTIWSTYESPLGRLTLVAGPRGLRAISFPGRDAVRPERDHARDDPDAFAEVTGQLDEYFAGVRRTFDVALDLDQGTPFARSVSCFKHSLATSHNTVCCRATSRCFGVNPPLAGCGSSGVRSTISTS